MAWIYLILAGLFEVVWAIEIKYSDGFTKLWPSIITVAAMIFSFIALSLAVREIPLGTAYAIWTGIGAAGAVLFGMLWLGEPATFWRLISITALLMGMIGLKLTT